MDTLKPIVAELRVILDGLQYILDQGSGNKVNCDKSEGEGDSNEVKQSFYGKKEYGKGFTYSDNDPRSPVYRDPKGKKSKYTNKSTDKYNKNKERNSLRPPKPPRQVKDPKPKPVKVKKTKEFFCYIGDCGEKFNVWKDARAHFKDSHNVDKPKYKRSKNNIKLASNTVSPEESQPVKEEVPPVKEIPQPVVDEVSPVKEIPSPPVEGVDAAGS